MSEMTICEPELQQSSTNFENEFNYRPVPALAPVALFMGVCSALALLTVFGLSVAIFSLVLGLIAVVQIRRRRDELGGYWLAVSGFLLSGVFFLVGTAMHSYTYATEVPEGFTRVNFTRDISLKGFVTKNNKTQPHKDVVDLNGKKIFLKGYIYPTGKTNGLSSFILVKDSEECCFGGEPKIWDMIRIVMQDGQTIDYRQGLTSVAGTFRVQGTGKDNTELTAVYQIDATLSEPSKFSF